MRALLLSVLALAALAPPAAAVQMVGTNGTGISRFSTDSLGTVSSSAITGMEANEELVGLDYRGATGQLYGVSDDDRLYVINAATGAATLVAGTDEPLVGTDFGTDFNPVTDRLRNVSDADQNVQIAPLNADTTANTALNPANPNIVALAYTNNVPGAATTTLFGINSSTGVLVRIGGVDGTPSPDLGTVTTVGSLLQGSLLTPSIGFDIGPEGNFATITSGPTTRLYGINLGTGAATNLGTIGDGSTPFVGIAMVPGIEFASATAAASEGAEALVEVRRNGPTFDAVSATYSTVSGSAGPGEDFTPVSGTVSWAAGETGPKTIAIPVVADAGAESAETFTVELSNPTKAALDPPTTSTVTIAANEAGPTLQVASPSVTATEGGEATVEVTRVGPTTHPVSAEYTTAPGTAGESDYTPALGTVSWPAGDGAPKTISVPITNDSGAEGTETFGVNLVNPAGGATLGTPAAAEVTIAASDPSATVLKLAGKGKQKLRTVRRRGVAIVARVDKACDLDASLRSAGRRKRIGRARPSLVAGRSTLRIKVKAKKDRRRLRAGQRLTVSATCADAAGKSRVARRTIRLQRG
jgi:hypothetical protein